MSILLRVIFAIFDNQYYIYNCYEIVVDIVYVCCIVLLAFLVIHYLGLGMSELKDNPRKGYNLITEQGDFVLRKKTYKMLIFKNAV